MSRVIFLGSGGGRHMCASQTRRTGGLYVEYGTGQNLMGFSLDPGPGALVHAVALGLAPEKWKGIVISHFHIDHMNDATALIDAIDTSDKKTKGFPFLIAEEQFLSPKGKDTPFPRITDHHRELVGKLAAVTAGTTTKIGPLEITAVKAWHYCPNLGFVFRAGGTSWGYPADGSYYAGQEKAYEGCDLLILNVPWQKGHDAPKGIHMTLDDAIALVKAMKTKPRLVVLTHLSFSMLRANLYKQEKIFKDATGVKCISADDFMELDLETLQTRVLAPAEKKA